MTDMLLAWAASASALIVVVLLLRWVAGRRISAGLRYGIWAVVLIRLLVPGSLALSVTIPRLPSWEPPEDPHPVRPVSSISAARQKQQNFFMMVYLSFLLMNDVLSIN